MKTIEYEEIHKKAIETALSNKGMRRAAECVAKDWDEVEFGTFLSAFAHACQLNNDVHMGIMLNVMDINGYSREQIMLVSTLMVALEEETTKCSVQINNLIFLKASAAVTPTPPSNAHRPDLN